jgi:hypothetical protein
MAAGQGRGEILDEHASEVLTPYNRARVGSIELQRLDEFAKCLIAFVASSPRRHKMLLAHVRDAQRNCFTRLGERPGRPYL